ncbi:MAG: hypothetical protein FJY54_18620 [Betaproteobacteria bacterium]|nr:hypothetical protein [Betaproteobacteria bacterium]
MNVELLKTSAAWLLTALITSGAAPLARAADESQRLSRHVAADAGSSNAPLLFCIGMHIEPFGATPSKLLGDAAPLPQRPPGAPKGGGPGGPGGRPGPSYNTEFFFRKHCSEIREVAGIVERAGGKLTVQAQTPFTSQCVAKGEKLFGELEARGHAVALHLHEDAHLGRGSERLPVETWAAVMSEEIDLLRKCGAKSVRYWSGGNLYRGVLDAAARAGLDVMSDHKNPRQQQTDKRLLAVNPWRPAGGPTETDLDQFTRHDSKGKIIYLPDGLFSRTDHAGMRRSEQTGGDWKYFDFLTEGLEMSLRAARPDRVNVFHFTIHAGEFRGRTGPPFAVIEAWLKEVLAPLVKAGKVKWATFPEMADAFAKWEKANAGVDPRGPTTRGEAFAVTPKTEASAAPKGFITFVVNTHDWRFTDDSAETVLRLVGMFEKRQVRGDFYLTAPLVESYVAKRPDVIRRLKDSGMTISYHTRAPHALWRSFSKPLADKEGTALAGVLRDYETFQLDLRTGGLNRAQPGGYRYVEQVFGRKPVAVGTSDAPPPVKAASSRVFAELGAKVAVYHHETGTKLEEPFEFHEGLLARPSDFSVTRFPLPNNPQGTFWWSMVGTPREAEFDPVASLKKQLAEWRGPRAPFITVLIHENDFYREGGPGWNSIYFTGQGAQARPRRAPFDLDTPPTGRARPAETREAIFSKYEELVARAAATLRIVTSEDIAALAQKQQPADKPSSVTPPRQSDAVAPVENQRRSAETPLRTPRASGELPQSESAFIRIPSSAAGTEGVAASVLIPRQPRFTNGAPVVINVTGGVQAGSARGRPEYVGHGFVEIHFAFPGGGVGDERSGGAYDFRGSNCVRALADVIRFATGRIAAKDGRRIGELARGLTVLTNNVGLVGSSHGGNASGMAMAKFGDEFPNLAWYASMESPYGEGAANVELGGHESGLNPAYDPKTGLLDLSKLAWSSELSPGLFRKPMLVATREMNGAFYFDLNGDGRFSRDDDFPCNCFVGDAGAGVKAWYSPRILAEAEKRALIRSDRPSHVPTLAEAREFWSWRDAAPSIPEAVRRCTNLAVIVYANERDHVQADPAHTHILEQAEGFRQAGARFVRLNPDRAYVEHLTASLPPRLRAGVKFPDNPAGKTWTRSNINEGLEPSGLPLGLYMQAAICELADRTQAGNGSANLAAVLFPDAPRAPAPPPRLR